MTGAYLSSEGNAFSTRTASQIVQENFNPGEISAPGGPLFGVQFSQLPCSDLVRRPGDGSVGPKRSPLGLSADAGGLPLYKGGTVVGATDEYGYQAVENPKSVYELHATILHLLGLDFEKLTYRFNGRDMRLTDVHGAVIREVLR